jgi:probable F420-dependent oxidoreductase
VRFGLITPVVTLNPRVHNSWEETAGLESIAAVAEAADRLGYHHVTCSEHVAVPTEAVPRRGGRYWDPLATFGYLAARTSRLRLATHVLVLGYHHPLDIAKRYGTLDLVSGGRLVLGVGVGTLAEEFELLGAELDGRGARADDAIRALRASLSRREPTYHGEHFRYQGFVVDPCAVQERVPIWVGGRTTRSLRRAVELGDGWAPFGLGEAQLAAMLTRARQSAAWVDRPAPLEVVLYPEPPLDPVAEPEQAREVVGRYERLGATILNLRLQHRSLAHCLEQLQAMVEAVPPEDGPPAA